MGIIVAILLGALVGWIVSKINGTDAQQGWIGNIVLGILGAVVGTFIWNKLGGHASFGLNLVGILVAIAGGLIVSYLFAMVTGKKAL